MEFIDVYKKHLRQYGLADELFKWELLAKYKGQPSLDPDKFAEELKSIDFRNLLFYNALSVRNLLLKERPDEYKECFITLFDESISLAERIRRFDSDILKIYSQYYPHLGHHHDERTISVFLTFHNPQKYTFYKSSFYKKYCDYLGVKPKKKGEKFAHYLELIRDLIENHIKPDRELIELFREKLPKEVFKDEGYMVLAQDILYLTFDMQINDKQQYWMYAPGENAELWDEFYENKIMALGWDELGDLEDYESPEKVKLTLQKINKTDRSKKNDTSANVDFKEKMQVGDIVIVKRGRSELLGYGVVNSECYFDEGRKYFKNCRDVEWKKRGSWKTDHSLALKTLTDITQYKTEKSGFKYYYETLLALMEDKKVQKKFPLNQILYGPPGTGKTYKTVDLAYRIVHNIATEVDIPYEIARKWYKEELAKEDTERQIDFITFHQNYSYEDFIMGIKPSLTGDGLGFKKHKGVFFEICERALANLKQSTEEGTDIIPGFSEVFEEFLRPLVIDGNEITVKMKREEFNITSLNEKNLNFRKQNGGSGHTLSFKTIVELYNGEREYNLQGLGVYYYPLVDALKAIATAQTKHVNKADLKNYVIIIDEINRANISRVFGELITLIEEDKRWGNTYEMEVRLPDGKTQFSVPKNLYIIGTMNTADKSIALLDIALRRRFEFVALYPDTTKVEAECRDFFMALNETIKVKKGIDFMIGHSYFMKREGQAFDFVKVMNAKVIPLLSEYFYNPRGGDEVKNLVNNALSKASSLSSYEAKEDNCKLIISKKDAGN